MRPPRSLIFALVRLALVSLVISSGCASTRPVAGPLFEAPYPIMTPPREGEIYHLPTGLFVPKDGLFEMVAGARLVSVGETHDNIRAKQVALEILKELDRRFPGKVALGMEMFREPNQPVLDRWSRGEIADEMAFIRESNWYDVWRYDFAYYRDLLLFAREKGIDVIALNPSKELQDRVRATGLDNVPEDLRNFLPEIGPVDPLQKAVIAKIFGGHMSVGDGRFDAFYRTQMLWEETMAKRIADYLSSDRGKGKVFVSLTGGWHVRYGFGLPKKVVRRLPLPYTIVMPYELSTPEQREGREMEVDLPDTPLYPADFYWFVGFESLEERHVRMGVGLSTRENAVVVDGVLPGSPAEAAGVKKGDLILSFDGTAVVSSAEVIESVNRKREGDKATLVLRRDGAEEQVTVTFEKMKKEHGK